jgi:ubiquinone biosynthesis protein UbiJ
MNDDVAFYSSKIFEYVKTRREEVGSSIERNIKEYLKDETDIIPTKEEITNYVSDVDKVRQKLDLLTAKLNKIKSK